jgi:aminoglycoside 6'-N-acetyltransferase I
MQITDVQNDNIVIHQIAEILMKEFKENGAADWANFDEALAEVQESLDENRISRVAIGANTEVFGWIGAIHSYARVWELHPLVVRSDLQNRGIGTALVKDLERQVKARGGMTITLGTDDENARTSLGGIELYPNPLEKISKIKNLRRHPFEFYRKLGYVITGVVPDANGFGKPDILMCKRV